MAVNTHNSNYEKKKNTLQIKTQKIPKNSPSYKLTPSPVLIPPRERKVVCSTYADADGHQCRSVLDYDHLVVAVGAEPNTFNIPGVKERALMMKGVCVIGMLCVLCAITRHRPIRSSGLLNSRHGHPEDVNPMLRDRASIRTLAHSPQIHRCMHPYTHMHSLHKHIDARFHTRTYALTHSLTHTYSLTHTH